MKNLTFFDDKIYINEDFFMVVKRKYNSQMLTSVKAVKGMPDVLKKIDQAANNLY